MAIFKEKIKIMTCRCLKNVKLHKLNNILLLKKEKICF